MSLRLLLFLQLLFVSIQAQSATFNLQGRSISVDTPTGYCEVGGQTADNDILQLNRNTIGPDNQLLTMIVVCKELDDYRNRRRTMVDNYGIIVVQAPKGQIRIIKGGSRAEFIRQVATSANNAGTADTIKKAEARLKQNAPTLQNIDVENLGLLATDSNGLYMGVIKNMKFSNGESLSVVGVMGMTLVKDIIISIILYQPTTSSQSLQNLLTRQQSRMADFVKLNY